MNQQTVLITGAGGEMGHALVNFLSQKGNAKIVAIDVRDAIDTKGGIVDYYKADIREAATLNSIGLKYNIDTIFHLAAILSTGGEKDPLRAHDINVNGSLNLLALAKASGEKTGRATKFIFPSTIAIYGIATPAEKSRAGAVNEGNFLEPLTMYGMNKLYIEHLGRYYDSYFRYLENNEPGKYVDFRSIRFPGILSAETVPTGGTSDYGPEMLHFAAQGKDYQCFVGPEARIPFMVMPDAVKALLDLAAAPSAALSRHVYNVTSFAPSAKEIEAEIKKYFPNAKVSYQPHQKRFSIVESWPADLDDSAARTDWGWKPEYNFTQAFEKYLVPAVKRRYQGDAAAKQANY